MSLNSLRRWSGKQVTRGGWILSLHKPKGRKFASVKWEKGIGENGGVHSYSILPGRGGGGRGGLLTQREKGKKGQLKRALFPHRKRGKGGGRLGN